MAIKMKNSEKNTSYKAHRTIFLIGAMIFISLFMINFGSATWYNSTWQSKKLVTVNFQDNVNLSGYWVELDIPFENGKMASDWSDLRIINYDENATYIYKYTSKNSTNMHLFIFSDSSIGKINNGVFKFYIYYNANKNVTYNWSNSFYYGDTFTNQSSDGWTDGLTSVGTFGIETSTNSLFLNSTRNGISSTYKDLPTEVKDYTNYTIHYNATWSGCQGNDGSYLWFGLGETGANPTQTMVGAYMNGRTSVSTANLNNAWGNKAIGGNIETGYICNNWISGKVIQIGNSADSSVSRTQRITYSGEGISLGSQTEGTASYQMSSTPALFIYANPRWAGNDVKISWLLVSNGNGTITSYSIGEEISSRNINIYLSSPQNNSIVSSPTINFESNMNITGANYSYQWKNLTNYVWFLNGTLFKTTTEIGLTGNITNVSQNIGDFNLGRYLWNVYACYGNATLSFCNWSNNGNYSFTSGLQISSTSYNSTSNPTSTETFILQGIKNIVTSSINATFYYNGTAYPSTVTYYGNNVNISNTITIPPSSFGNTSFYWTITSFGTIGSITQNSSTYYQYIGNLSIDYCTGVNPFGLTLNFTLYDESTKNKLNGSFESTFTYFSYGGSGAYSKTLYFSSINQNKSNWMFCINSSANASFSGTASYYADFYDRREYIFSNATVGNFTQNIPLYLSLIADTDVVTVTVQDRNYNPISGALVYIQEWNVGTNTYSTIGMFNTDSNGNGIINLELYNKWYRAVVSIDGEIVKTTDVQKLADTTWFINVELATANPYELFDSISHGLTFDNETNITTFVWTDGSGYIQSGCLYIYNNTNTGYSLIHSECVSSVAGIINYLLPGDGDYQVVGTIYLTPDYNVSKVIDVLFVQIGVPELTRIVSPFGKILTFLFVGVATFLGVSVGSPIWGSMLLIGSLFLTFKLGWIKLSSAILWGLLSVVIVIIFRQKRRVG